jgi:hypothetical protein
VSEAVQWEYEADDWMRDFIIALATFGVKQQNERHRAIASKFNKGCSQMKMTYGTGDQPDSGGRVALM